MTVQNQNVKNVYRGNGSTTVFPFTFAINADHPEYIHVYITNDGELAVETTDFTCDMDARTITYPKPTSPAPKLSATQRLTIYRFLPYEQNLNLVNQGPFFSEDVETTFDDLEMQIQQLAENLIRCFQIGIEAEDFNMTMELEPDKVICVNSEGNGFEAREALMEVNGAWDGENRRIHNVMDPAADQDAATKKYTDNNFMKLDGDHWEARNLPVGNVGGPRLVKDAVTKDYVDRILAGYSGYGERLAIFDNVAQMKAAELVPSQMAVTQGYYEPNDGGHGVYVVRAKLLGENPNDGAIIQLSNDDYIAELIIDNVISVKTFGAKGDNTQDDTDYIQAAIDYICGIGGGTVFFPKGNYKITNTISVNTSNVKLQGEGKYLSVICPTPDLIVDADNLNVKWSIYVKNNNPTVVTSPSAKVSYKSTTISVTDATGIEAGMLLYMRGDFSTSPWTSNNRGSAVKGETNKVLSVSGTTVTLETPTSEVFETTEIVTLTFVKPLTDIVINGLGVTYPDNCPEDERQYRGFCVQGCDSALITDCYGNGCGMVCFESADCYMSKIHNNVVNDCWAYYPNTTTIYGLGYGLHCTNDNLSEITNNQGRECRHIVDISGGYPSHAIKVSDNVFVSYISEYGVVSTHGPAEGCVIENNIVIGNDSLMIRGEGIVVRNNYCRGSVKNYYGRNNTYENNVFKSAMTIGQEDTIENSNYMIIRNNTFYTTAALLVYLSKISEVPFTTATGWVVEGNVSIQESYASTTSKVNFFSISYSDSETITFKKGFVYKNNITRSQKTNDVYSTALMSDPTVATIGGTYDPVITDEYVINAAPNKAIKGESCFVWSVKKPAWFDGTKWRNALDKQLTLNASIPPQSGTYEKGAIVWNSQPSVGEYIGWVCVTAGEPGTWKGFGAIEA